MKLKVITEYGDEFVVTKDETNIISFLKYEGFYNANKPVQDMVEDLNDYEMDKNHKCSNAGYKQYYLTK